MTSKELSYGILRAIGITAAICLLVFFLWKIRAIFAYLAIAFVLAMIGRPLMNLLTRKLKFPNALASAVTLFLFILMLSAFVSLFISLVLNQSYQLFGSFSQLEHFEETIQNQINKVSESLGLLNIPFLEKLLDDAVKGFNSQSVSGIFGSSLSTLGGLFIDTFSVMFITFFFLKDRKLINKLIMAVAPKKEESRFENVLSLTKDLLSRYFIGLTLQALVMFTFFFIILLSFGIKYAAVIALICALFNLVPYLGPIGGALIIGSLSLSDLHSMGLDFRTETLPTLMWIMVWFLVAQAWDNFINQPLIYSKSVKSNPLEIFIVILIGGILFGVIGVLVAVPSYTVIRVLLKEFFSEYKIVRSITKNI